MTQAAKNFPFQVLQLINGKLSCGIILLTIFSITHSTFIPIYLLLRSRLWNYLYKVNGNYFIHDCTQW